MASPPPSDPAVIARSLSSGILLGSITPLAIASVFVFGRFYSRAVVTRKWGQDDTWILVSWILSIGITTLNCVLATYSGSDMSFPPKIGFIARLLYQACLGTTKYGVCAFYRKIFQGRQSEIFVLVMATFVTLYTFPLVIDLIFRCNPIRGNWMPEVAKCHNDVPALIASTVANILADVIFLVFIVPKIIQLNISRPQKIGMLVIVSLSILIIIAAIIRITRVIQALDINSGPHIGADVAVWSSVEINTGIFCASALAIKPLLKKIAHGLLSNFSSLQKPKPDTRVSGKPSTIGARHIRAEALRLDSQAEPEEKEIGSSQDISGPESA